MTRSEWGIRDPDPSTRAGKGIQQTRQNFVPFYVSTLPPVVYEEDIQVRMTDLKTVLDEHIITETARFMTGARPLNQAEFEAYGNEIKALGYDEYIDIYVKTLSSIYR